MKINHLYILAFSFLFTLSSCSKDDSKIILGTWEYNSTDVQIKADNSMMASILASFIKLEIENQKPDEFSITFNKSGNATIVISKNGERKTYTEAYSLENEEYLTIDIQDIMTDVSGVNMSEVSSKSKYSLTKESLTLENSFSLEDWKEMLPDEPSDTIEMPGIDLASIGLKDITFYVSFDKK